jgi:hypothetical protein
MTHFEKNKNLKGIYYFMARAPRIKMHALNFFITVLGVNIIVDYNLIKRSN